MTAREVTRRIQMPPTVWRHAVLGRRCTHPWALLAAHAVFLADEDALWFAWVTFGRHPVQPWEERALAC